MARRRGARAKRSVCVCLLQQDLVQSCLRGGCERECVFITAVPSSCVQLCEKNTVFFRENFFRFVETRHAVALARRLGNGKAHGNGAGVGQLG